MSSNGPFSPRNSGHAQRAQPYVVGGGGSRRHQSNAEADGMAAAAAAAAAATPLSAAVDTARSPERFDEGAVTQYRQQQQQQPNSLAVARYGDPDSRRQQQQVIVAPRADQGQQHDTPFWWNVSQPGLDDNQIRKAFCDMDFTPHVGIPCNGDMLHFKVDGMINVEPLVKAFLNNVVVAQVCSDVYKTSIEVARGLNFVVVGPSGNGKRTTVKQACVYTNITYMTVSPSNYRRGYIILAVEYATYDCKPSLIYVDDFDVLCMNPEFVEEYRTACKYRTISGKWDHVWMVLSTTSMDREVNALAELACWTSNYVIMPAVDSEVLANFLFNNIARKRIAVRPELTSVQWASVLSVLSGASFHEVEAFTNRIALLAIRNTSISDLLAMSKTDAAKSLLKNSTQGSSAPTRQADAQTQFVVTTIDWADVEGLYVAAEASADGDGTCRLSIPKDFSLQ